MTSESKRRKALNRWKALYALKQKVGRCKNYFFFNSAQRAELKKIKEEEITEV